MTATAADRVRVVVVDDHAVVRKGIRGVLSEAQGFEVVGEASTGAEALAMLSHARPDVVVLDITLPGPSGLEVAAEMRRRIADLKILILSMHDDAQYVVEAVRVGVQGYLLKDSDPADIRSAVRAVASGETLLGPQVARQLSVGLREEQERERLTALAEDLTPRERDVLVRVAGGLTSKQIAAELDISHRTVESHRESLMRKLDIRSVAGLTRFAMEVGMIPR